LVAGSKLVLSGDTEDVVKALPEFTYATKQPAPR
jgi:hypothetical protein